MTTHKPATEEEISSLVRDAATSRKPLAIIGGGTRPVGNPVTAGHQLQTTGLKGITLYEPGALTIIAKTGTTLDAMNKALAKENQQFPFEPADYSGLFGIKGKSTIGGVVGTGVSGPRRLQAGGARDSGGGPGVSFRCERIDWPDLRRGSLRGYVCTRFTCSLDAGGRCRLPLPRPRCCAAPRQPWGIRHGRSSGRR